MSEFERALLRKLKENWDKIDWEQEEAICEKAYNDADLIIESNWSFFGIRGVNQRVFEERSPWLPLARFSETVSNSGISRKRLAVIVVPSMVPIAPGATNLDAFNFVQALKTNGFSEVVIQAADHGRPYRVDPEVYGF